VSVTLNNKKILVTRPKHQADYLCDIISDNGGQAVSFPTIEIQAVEKSENLSALFNTINEYDFVIFVSRNAARIAFDLYLDESDIPEQVQVVAIGSGTADILTGLSITKVLHAGLQADSETLLQIPELQKEILQDKKILIVRGVGGRSLLADNLKDRGASVEYAEVYKRCLPEYEMKDSHKIWQDIKPEAVIVTSNEGLNNLVSLTLENDQQQLFSTPLVAISERNADLAKELGFISELRVAKGKNDEGLLSALLELVGE
jgi:uroporphyrinogen-III synthase